MGAEMIIGLSIFSVVAGIMVLIGISQKKQKDNPVGFYNLIDPPKKEEISDVIKWNRKHGTIWIMYGICIELGFWLGYVMPVEVLKMVFMMGGVIIPLPVMVMLHRKLEKEYKPQLSPNFICARTENVILTNMCMVFRENRVLVQDRKDDDYSGIMFPGGHVEKGESFTDAVIREVWEETGLKISAPKLCGTKDWMSDDETRYVVLLYKTDQFEGTVASSEEGDVFWLTLEEMKQRKLAYGMDKMLEVFLNEHLSEYFFHKEDDKWIEELK